MEASCPRVLSGAGRVIAHQPKGRKGKEQMSENWIQIVTRAVPRLTGAKLLVSLGVPPVGPQLGLRCETVKATVIGSVSGTSASIDLFSTVDLPIGSFSIGDVAIRDVQATGDEVRIDMGQSVLTIKSDDPSPIERKV